MITRSSISNRRGRLAAGSVAVLMALSACGASDDADESAATDPPAASSDETSEESDPVVAVLEMSPELTTVGAALPQLDNDAPDAAIGTPAPVVTGQRFDGTDISIGESAGDPTMLVFLAHWCPHCNDEIPELLELRDSGGLPSDLNVIGVSTAVASDRDNFPPSQWIDDKGWEWPVLADTESAEAFQTYGGNGFPFTVLLDADGNVLARQSGSRAAADIEAWIDEALNRA